MTPKSALDKPDIDPTPIFEIFRGSYGSELLTAAIAHFQIFELLSEPLSFMAIQSKLELASRPTHVLLTAVQAFGLVEKNANNLYSLTPLAQDHLLQTAYFNVADYVGLANDSPGVLEMVDRLRTNRPAGLDSEEDQGAAFIYRDGLESAMEEEQLARHFTLALAGRAKNVAPYLAESESLANARRLLDVAGGTGIYSIAFLQQHPEATAVVLDRPEVLKIAHEMAEEYGVLDRLDLQEGDMFRDSLATGADTILLSNVLHDWDVPECQELVKSCADALPDGGRLIIHDVYLDDDLAGPLPIALYSAALFTLTEGRAYSAAEYGAWMQAAGLQIGSVSPTLIHCGTLVGTK